MTLLAQRKWNLKYTPDDGDLLQIFHIPALEDAVRYDRLTGFFDARALALAARGIEGLVHNGGRMRLVVGCTLGQAETQAIERGEELRALVEKRMKAVPLAPSDAAGRDALELLTWMIEHGFLDVKVAVPCDGRKRPIPNDGIFHEKAAIIEDREGDKIAWNGSLNETGKGWHGNWESINVYTSWGGEPQRVQKEEENFARIWAGQSGRLLTLDVPSAVRQELMRFLPEDDRLPARLKGRPPTPSPEPPPSPAPQPLHDLRNRVWSFIQNAPKLPDTGDLVGEATAAVTPWPHQVRAFERLYRNWPPKLLIADEVGLGKTIQAGLLLRQAWLAGRAKRILILAPKAVLPQWQIELREKFNLNWPIYDGAKLSWFPSPALRENGNTEKPVTRNDWHREAVVLVSSHLLRRQDRAKEVLENADPWDLVILDEAHHARRREPGNLGHFRPNAMLRLMHELKDRTQGLVLLTATPMQVHPVETWDLLNLLGMPEDWAEDAFLRFFEDTATDNPSNEAFERLAPMFQAMEQVSGEISNERVMQITGLSRIKASVVLEALRNRSSIPRRRLETSERQAAVKMLRRHTPVTNLISRHTRELLRRYSTENLLETKIADRNVIDEFIEMSAGEAALYKAVEDYISTTYNKASANVRSAVGFTMTVYRRRLASSINALRQTLERRLRAIEQRAALSAEGLDEDVMDEEQDGELLGFEEAADLEHIALAAEEKDDIAALLNQIRSLPHDTKADHLVARLAELRKAGYEQVMVFTQYTDTLDFLREKLRSPEIMCFSGRGGEILSASGRDWQQIGRDTAKQKFLEGEASVLLCSEAAAEGLNFQFCGALVNYDMPWNPMRVEQRIGRIDRLGQKHQAIQIVNLHYEGTVEADAYRVLRERIGLFQSVIGKLQPILAELPQRLSQAVLEPGGGTSTRSGIAGDIAARLQAAEADSFDLNALTDDDWKPRQRPQPALTLADLGRILHRAELMPPGQQSQRLGSKEFSLRLPGRQAPLRITTDPGFYEQNADSVELWSPGNPIFLPPDPETAPPIEPADLPGKLDDLLD